MTTVPQHEATATDAVTLSDDVGGEPSQPPRTVGPYVLLERLGEGGMGVVYRAHDPRLGREVAIKLLRADVARPGERARARLVREARAMAHLAHPNVVQVFDVGTVGRQVFVAMELVEGGTLTRWLRARPRSTPEILDAFVQAGRGLAAAHDKGVVHRDFKPDNVLVGDDGRVRVTDFGLARAIEDDPRSGRRSGAEPPWSEPDAADAVAADAAPTALGPGEPARRQVTRDEGLAPLTRTGVVMGTPAYMALEQHVGGQSDARTDQFAFCVALFEALAGHRPFSGSTDLELGRAKRDMRVRELPARPGLRPALRRAILRGLQPDPAARWPSMEPLLAAMAPARRVRAWAGLAIGVGGALAAGLWVASPAGEVDRCESGELRTERVWNDDRRAAVERSLSATGVPYADDAWPRVRGRVDDHVAQWRAAHDEVCAAAASEAAPDDGRMHCLDRTLAHLDGLVGTLAQADAALVERAVELASSLRSPAACLDPQQTRRVQPTAPTPALAEAWARQDDALARVELLLQAGRGQGALALAQDLVKEAEGAAWPPLRAQALFGLGNALEAVADFRGAEQALVECHGLANALELDWLAAQAAAQLVWVAGPRRLDEDEARRWARHARTSLERMGGDASIEAHLENALGSMYLSLGQAGPAEVAYRRALALYREQHGDGHPHVAVARSNLGAALAATGDYTGSLEHQEAAVEIWRRTLGEQHPAMADAIDNTALAHARLGRFDDAVAAQERALALRRLGFDPNDLSIATSLNNLGAFEEARGNYEQAEAHHREALALHEAVLGPDDLRVAASRVNLGLTVLRRQRYAEARALAERAVSELERAAPEHPYLGHALVLLGSAAERGGDVATARAASERVLARCDGGSAAFEAMVCTEARWVLARALGAAPEGRARALSLARQVQRELRAASEASPTLAREVDEWVTAVEAGAPPGLTPSADDPPR